MKKKNIILLGGNTKNNIEWIKKTKKQFVQDYNVYELYYDHWYSNSEININSELDKLVKIANKKYNYCIVSKSIGSIISLIGIQKERLKPQKLVIMGLPLRYIERVGIDIGMYLDNALIKTKVIIIQQENDPIGKYNEVAKLLCNKNIELVRIPGHYHVYNNMKCIIPIVEKFLNSEVIQYEFKSI